MSLRGLLLVVCLVGALATELTFDMEPHERQCFKEMIEKDLDVTVEYQVRPIPAATLTHQVIYGGRLDVDMDVEFQDSILHSEKGQQAGSFTFKAEHTGEYRFCFRFFDASQTSHEAMRCPLWPTRRSMLMCSRVRRCPF